MVGSNDRIITISGNQDQINHAQYLMQKWFVYIEFIIVDHEKLLVALSDVLYILLNQYLSVFVNILEKSSDPVSHTLCCKYPENTFYLYVIVLK